MPDLAIVFAVSFGTVLVTVPLVRRLAQRLGAVAEPGGRHIHTRATPSMGGLALLAGVLAAIAVASRLGGFAEVFRTTGEPEAVVLASLVVCIVGVLDDTRGLSAPAKLAGQILAAGTLVLFGLSLSFVYLPGNPPSVVSLSPDLAALVTILLIVAMINAVNLVDGLDGLAAGIVTIAASALLAYAQFVEATTAPTPSSSGIVLAATTGACLAFLVYNFNPAWVFMGDTGAMLLGLLLAAGGVSAIGRIINPTTTDFAAISTPVLVPALVLAVPFADTAWTILRRLLSGRAVFSPDKQHLHHRLMEIGHSHRRAVLIMYYWSALVAFGAVGASLLPRRAVLAVLAAGVGLALVARLTGRLAARRTSRRLRAVPGAGTLPGAGRAARRARAEHASDTAVSTDEPENFVLSFTKSDRRGRKSGSDQRKRRSGPL